MAAGSRSRALRVYAVKLFALVTVPTGVAVFVTVIVPVVASAGTVAFSLVLDT